LPQTLTILDCSKNIITRLDNLPLTLKKLDCSDNPIEFDYITPTLENIRTHNKT